MPSENKIPTHRLTLVSLDFACNFFGRKTDFIECAPPRLGQRVVLGCRVGNAHSNSSVQWTKDSFGLGLKESLRDTWSNLRILDPNPESKSSKFLPRGHPQIIYNAILLLCNDSMPLCNTSSNPLVPLIAVM